MTSSHHEGLLRHSVLLMLAQQIGNASTLGFQVVMGRTLDDGEYAVLYSLLGLMLIFATPTEAVRTAVAHFAARLRQDGREGDIRFLLRRWYLYLAWIAIPLVLAGTLGATRLAAFFHVESALPVTVTALCLALSLYLPLFHGGLLGLQSFVWLSVASHTWGVVRLIAGAALVLAVSATALSALVGQLVAVVVAILVGMWGLHCVIGDRALERTHVKGTRRYVARSAFILAGYAVLMNADIVLIRHHLPAESEMYAKASMVAKSVIFFAQPIVAAMFPKVTSIGTTSSQNWKTLLYALALSGLCIAAIAGVVLIFPRFPLLIIFDQRSPSAELVRMVRMVIVAMCPLGLSFLLMNFELAQHRFGAAFPLIGCAAVFVGGAWWLHESVWHIIGWLAVGSFSSLALLIAGLPWRSLRRA